jgi:orotidine-5'-phosphate decarboxylase
MEKPSDRLIIALDYPDLPPALALAERLGPQVGLLKVGLQLFNSAGPQAIRALRDLGPRVFYDSKLYDIPNTVAGAAAALARLGVSMFNVHALGGSAMMRAAKRAALRAAEEAGLPPPLVVAVTIVTSLGDDELQREIGLHESSQAAVPRLASLAREAELDGVVCSVREVPEIKRICGKDFLTVTPGIRPAWAARGDQARVATPREALASGADYLVIGRPITGAHDPQRALQRVLAELTG